MLNLRKLSRFRTATFSIYALHSLFISFSFLGVIHFVWIKFETKPFNLSFARVSWLQMISGSKHVAFQTMTYCKGDFSTNLQVTAFRKTLQLPLNSLTSALRISSLFNLSLITVSAPNPRSGCFKWFCSRWKSNLHRLLEFLHRSKISFFHKFWS